MSREMWEMPPQPDKFTELVDKLKALYGYSTDEEVIEKQRAFIVDHERFQLPFVRKPPTYRLGVKGKGVTKEEAEGAWEWKMEVEGVLETMVLKQTVRMEGAFNGSFYCVEYCKK